MHVGTRAESAEMPRQNELMVLSIVIEAWPGLGERSPSAGQIM